MDYFVNEVDSRGLLAYVQSTQALHPLCHGRGFETLGCAAKFEIALGGRVDTVMYFNMRRPPRITAAEPGEDPQRQPAALPGGIPEQRNHTTSLQRDSLAQQNDVRPGDSGQTDNDEDEDDDDDDHPSPGGAGISMLRNDSIATQHEAIQRRHFDGEHANVPDGAGMGPLNRNPFEALPASTTTRANNAMDETPSRANAPPTPVTSPARTSESTQRLIPSLQSLNLGNGTGAPAIGQQDNDDDLLSNAARPNGYGRGPRLVTRTIYRDEGESTTDSFLYQPTQPQRGSTRPTFGQVRERIHGELTTLMPPPRDENDDQYEEHVMVSRRAEELATLEMSRRAVSTPDFQDQIPHLAGRAVPSAASREQRRTTPSVAYTNGFAAGESSPARTPPTRQEVDGYDVNEDGRPVAPQLGIVPQSVTFQAAEQAAD